MRRRLRTQVGGELDRLVLCHFRDGSKPWRATKIAIVAAIGVFILHWASPHHNWFVEHFSAVRDVLPMHVMLERLPLSLVAPAPKLPVWGALAQVMLVFWLAELNLGVPLTLGLIVIYHVTSTLAGRVMVQMGSHAFLDLGVAHRLGFFRDTGPSAAVVGLCVYLGIKLRTPVLASLVVVAMVIEVVWQPDQAGREHCVAIVVALLTAIPMLWSRHRERRRTEIAANAAPSVADRLVTDSAA